MDSQSYVDEFRPSVEHFTLQPILRSAQRLKVDSDENHGCIPQIDKVSMALPFLSSLLTHVASDEKECIGKADMHVIL